MNVILVGMNHKTAPLEIRERLTLSCGEGLHPLEELLRVEAVQEALYLSTCNRVEVVARAGDVEEAVARVKAFILRHGNLDAAELEKCLYVHCGSDAVRHLFRVASSLDSMVMGEPQILGQMKDAYRTAQDAGTTGPVLNRLFQAAFSVAKRVRTETQIGANAVSVASAAVAMAKTVFASFENRTALMVGAGETIALAARHLHADGLRRMIVANRSIDRARELAAEFQGFAIGLDDIPAHLREADIVVASTASPNVIITREMAAQALRARKRRPIFMVDIAVPRDIEPEVAELEDVYLFTVDDLQSVVNENMENRRQAAREADKMIAAEVDRFELQQRTRDAAPIIRRLRHEAEHTRQHTLEQARRMLAAGRSQDEVLEFLSNTLMNRLIHAPSQRLRDAAETGDDEIVRAIADIYRLDHD